ncbi:MAG: agmatine deiminase family protein [Candidatus Eremiobacteraeota bacterium]|nr:agmatine deiminase family protein [Candidatus Eremiobacteraeota bacterium]
MDIWGDALEGVRRDITLLARQIRLFEPVSVIARPDQASEVAALLGADFTIVPMPVDDIWIRDSGPVFVKNRQHGVAGVDFNFNAWGRKQAHANDHALSRRLLEHLQLRRLTTTVVTEGGAIEADGDGTVLTTKSALLNPNRNPGWSKSQIEMRLRQALGAQKLIWLPGGNDYFTDGHIDGYARFVAPGTVGCEVTEDRSEPDYILARENYEVLKYMTDARGRKLQVLKLERPRKTRLQSPYFAANYVNFYVVNGGVLMPQFGDEERDIAAHDLIQNLFPNRRVVQLNIDHIASGGGGIHCVTLEQPV